jgi:hypothetical protein
MKMFVGSGFTARLAKPMATSPALQTSRRSRYINSSIYMPELSYLNRSKRGHWMRGCQFDRLFHVRTIDQFVAGESFIELNDWSIGKRAFAATNADSLGLTDGRSRLPDIRAPRRFASSTQAITSGSNLGGARND